LRIEKSDCIDNMVIDRPKNKRTLAVLQSCANVADTGWHDLFQAAKFKCGIEIALPNGFKTSHCFDLSSCESPGVGKSEEVPYGLQLAHCIIKNPVFIAETGFLFDVLLPNCCTTVGPNRTERCTIASKSNPNLYEF
jgi:hypothetical protein